MNEKDRILTNTSKLFLKRGVKALTMDEIASENGISKRTLYELFTDKENLLEACIIHEDAASRLRVVELERNSGNILEFLIKMYQAHSELVVSSGIDFFRDVKRYYPNVYKRTVECNREKRHEYINMVLETGQGQGVFEMNINRDLVARILSEILIESGFVENISGYEHSKKEVLWNTVILYLRGITTNRGRAVIDNFFDRQDGK